MDIKQMLYFKMIVDEGTISKAALKLHMAQPPLSMQLKSLENELGVSLLKRGKRNVTLTPAGKLFYKRATQILVLEELTLHEMKNVASETLRLGITSSNSAIVHEKKVIDFVKNHPSLSFRIKEGTTSEMIDLLQAHEIDVAIVRTPFNSLNVNAIMQEKGPMIAVGRKDIINPSMNKLSDYKDFPIIAHRRYFKQITDYCLNKLSFNPNIHIQADDCRTSIFWCNALNEIAIIPETALPLIKNLDLIGIPLIDQELYTSIAVVTRDEDDTSPTLLEFLNLFRDNI